MQVAKLLLKEWQRDNKRFSLEDYLKYNWTNHYLFMCGYLGIDPKPFSKYLTSDINKIFNL